MLSDIIDRMKLPFRKDKELLSSLHDIIGFYPHDLSHYKLALMHKSLFKRNDKGRPLNNERLEFLGDAVLDATVGDIVYRHFPNKREGFLTTVRSKLVKRETLNRLADEMGIVALVHTNTTGNTHNSYMGGNAFEALVGAIYLDRGYDACMRFMEKRILAQIVNIDKVAYKEVNFKSKIIEWCQKNHVKLEFRVVEQKRDKNGSPMFSYLVVLEGVEGCDGTGYSKKESQQAASKATLAKLRREPQFIDQVFAAKTSRTKMEEEPVTAVPNVGGTPKSEVCVNPEWERSYARQFEANAKRRPKRPGKDMVPDEDDAPASDESTPADEEQSASADREQRNRDEIIARAEERAFAGDE